MHVYINQTGRFLPGPAISNDEIEQTLGMVNGKPSRLKNKILKSNGIKTRHYAINAKHETEISNSKMAAKAGQACLDSSQIAKNQIDILSCATTQGDLVIPGFGSLVQAELDLSEIELMTTHGICSSSMMALKSAYTSIKASEAQNALVVASELASRLFKHTRYESVDNNEIDFNAEFLRWMLSDGAGALLLQNEPNPNQLSFRIDWIKSFSYANVYPTCMSIGSPKESTEKTWQDYPTYGDAEKAGALLLRQDVRMLDNIVTVGVKGFLKLIEQGLIKTSDIDHVLCHFSSKYFKSKIFEMLAMAGTSIAEEKWYTNLYERGNTGCAAMFIMLDEFIKTQQPKSGERILCMVPESGRFNCAYMSLTVV